MFHLYKAARQLLKEAEADFDEAVDERGDGIQNDVPLHSIGSANCSSYRQSAVRGL